MTFRPSVLPQRDDTFERAFQRGYNLVVGGQEQQRLQQEHEVRMTEAAERAEDRADARRNADLDRDLRRQELGLRRVPSEADVEQTDRISAAFEQAGVGRSAERVPQFFPEPQGAAIGPFAPEGRIPEEIMPQGQLDINDPFESRSIIPPDMPADTQIVGGTGDDPRYAYSNTLANQLESARTRASQQPRQSEVSEEDLAAARVALIKYPHLEDFADDPLFLLALADMEDAKAEDAPDEFDPGTDIPTQRRIAADREDSINEARDAIILEEYGGPAGLEAMPVAQREQAIAIAQQQATAQYDARSMEVDPNLGQTGAALAAPITEEEIAAQTATFQRWISTIKGNTNSLATIQTELGTSTQGAADREQIRTALAAYIDSIWNDENWHSKGQRPGASYRRGTPIFENAETGLAWADIIMGPFAGGQ